MAILKRKKSIRKLARPAGRAVKRQTASARSKLSKAAKALEKAAAVYAKRAGEAGVAAGKKARKLSGTRSRKILATAALAAAGYAASRVIRGK